MQWFAPLLAGIASSLSPLATETPLAAASRSARKGLGTAAIALARDGLADAAHGCAEEAARLAGDQAPNAAVLARLATELEKPPRSVTAATLSRHAKKLAGIASGLARAAEGKGDDLAWALRRAALRVDADCLGAHRALGHAEGADGRWRSEADAARWKRRGDLARCLEAVRTLSLDLELGTPRCAPLASLGAPLSALTYGELSIESVWPEAKLRSAFLGFLRASAFSSWLLGGELTPRHAPGHVAHVGDRGDYERLLDAALAEGVVDARRHAESRDLGGFWAVCANERRSSHDVALVSSLVSNMLVHYDRGIEGHAFEMGDVAVPFWVLAGHWNYVGLAVQGAPLNSYVVPKRGDDRLRTLSTREAKHLPNAGLRGSRAFLRALVREGRAPRLAACMLDHFGKLEGERLLKATSVVEYLHTRGEVAGFLDRYRVLRDAAPTRRLSAEQHVSRTEEALGCSLPDLERAWETWILGQDGDNSLTGRLERARAELEASEVEDPKAEALLSQLNALRAALEFAPVILDPDLSAGAALHAAYLRRHDEQLERWPDAHEERIDAKGFSPEGSWAGVHSLIAPVDPEACLDGWMATFYHRLPLVRPHLLAIGFGHAKGVSVLDASSMVDRAGPWIAMWPPAGGTDVPLGFRPELPSPVPGVDLAGLGYPITVEVGAALHSPRVTLALTRGDGTPVEAHVSTPHAPLNPDLVPDGAYALIPKQALVPNTSYDVHFAMPGLEHRWSFRTAAR